MSNRYEYSEGRQRFLEECEHRELKRPSQLPDISAAEFTLSWDIARIGTHLDTLIMFGHLVIFTEPAYWGGHRRFATVARILYTRYWSAIRDLVPTERSIGYLYGDSAFTASEEVARIRRVFFNSTTPSA